MSKVLSKNNSTETEPENLRHQFFFDKRTLGPKEDQVTFDIHNVTEPKDWPESKEFKTSQTLNLLGTNKKLKLELMGISYGDWLEMEVKYPMPDEPENDGTESQIQIEESKQEYEEISDQVTKKRNIFILEQATGKEIPGQTIEEKISYLSSFGSGEIEALMRAVLDKFSAGPMNSRLLGAYNDLEQRDSETIDFSGFDEWKSISSQGYTYRMQRPFENHIVEIKLNQVTDEIKSKIESQTKDPVPPSRPGINPQTGAIDPLTPKYNWSDPAWRNNMRKVSQIKIALMFDHCLPFDIPGNNLDEKYQWISKRLLGDVLNLKKYIEDEIFSYRSRFDFFTIG